MPVLQLRRIRTFTQNEITKEYDTNFEPDILVPSPEELFQNLDKIISLIPEFERYNCHYTLGDAPGGKTRGRGTFISQSLVPFDIDGIELTNEKKENAKIIARFKNIFFETTKFERDKTLSIFSGHGLHFVIKTTTWTDKNYFRKHSTAYENICTVLSDAFKNAGLKFKEIDRAVFLPNRMLRLPGTLNRKSGKVDRLCKIIEGQLQNQTLLWEVFEALVPKVKGKPQGVPPHIKQQNYGPPDTPAIESSCHFLTHCKENQAGVTEAQWYAALSIWSRLEGGEKKCHEYSKAHPKYTPEECDTKIKQALENSGPRTCENISTLWKGCPDCPWHGKVTSPIGIKREEFIASESNFFHQVVDFKTGREAPVVNDLCKFFSRQNIYKTSEENGVIWVWDGRKYDVYSDKKLEGFAGIHFGPKQPDKKYLSEFISRVDRQNLIPQKFFEGKPSHINFSNGVLNLKTKELSPHSPEDGFLWVLPYAYDPHATCPTFDAMMKRVTCEDKESEDVLLEFIGDALCDRTYWHQKALILVGEGSNGKSFFLDIVKALVGEENFSSVGIKEMDSPVKRYLLKGKLVNISDEMPSMKNTDTDTFKKLMGGSMIIEQKFQHPITMRCTTKFMFATNELPPSNDHSWGMLRRLLLVPFDAFFDRHNRDIHLMDKILGELPGIFNRILAAFEGLQKRGEFTESQKSAELLAEYRSDNNVIGTFIEENLTWKDSPWEKDDYVTFTDIMERLDAYGRLMNEDRFITGKKVALALKRAIPNFKKRKITKWNEDRTQQLMSYLGVRFKKAPIETYQNGKDTTKKEDFEGKLGDFEMYL